MTRDASHKPDYLVRMIHVVTHISGEITGEKYCLFVSRDGRFRLESSDSNYGSNAKPKVFLSSFTPEQLQDLRSILENKQLKELLTPGPRQQIVGRDLDMFAAEIARGDHVQDLNAFKDDMHSKIDPSLQALENWMNRMREQKWVQEKSAVANTCKAL